MDKGIYQGFKSMMISIMSVMPSIGSVWGVLFYALFSYIVTFLCVGAINYWADKNIDI